MLAEHAKTAPDEAQKALAGLKKLQNMGALPTQDQMPIVARAGRAVLRDYGGSGASVVFIPSLINPANILDITPERSLLRWLNTQGLHPYLIDWGDVRAEDHSLSVGDHVTDLIVPLIETLGAPAHLVGYCLGGTMALAAAHITNVQSLTMIAAPWHFAAYPDDAHAAMAKLWESAKPVAEAMGVLPMEALQLMFWQLDPAGTIAKYARYATMPEGGEEEALFIAMEQWANGGAPLPYAAARELFEDFYAANVAGQNEWQVAGRTITPDTLPCPMLDIISLNDKIVPSTTATRHPNRLEINRGHVGMLTGRHAKTDIWRPLRAWLSQLHKS